VGERTNFPSGGYGQEAVEWRPVGIKIHQQGNATDPCLGTIVILLLGPERLEKIIQGRGSRQGGLRVRMDQGLEPSEGGRARGFQRTGQKRQRERTRRAAEKEKHREKKGEPHKSLMEWTSSHRPSSNLTETRPIQSFPKASRRTRSLCGTIPQVNSGIRGLSYDRCMSAFAGYAHGSKSSIGEPGDSVLECGGRGALENGVPSREGQIMDGTTIELTEKLERLLREAAQVSVDLDRAKGTIVGVPHYSVIEARAHELGQQLSRQI